MPSDSVYPLSKAFKLNNIFSFLKLLFHLLSGDIYPLSLKNRYVVFDTDNRRMCQISHQQNYRLN